MAVNKPAKASTTGRKRGPGKPFEKGDPRAGRPAGSANKVTRETREAICELVDGAAPKLAGWLDQVAADDPGRALEIVARMAALVVPRATPAGAVLGIEALVAFASASVDVSEPAGRPEPSGKFIEPKPAARRVDPVTLPVVAPEPEPAFRMPPHDPLPADDRTAADYDSSARWLNT